VMLNFDRIELPDRSVASLSVRQRTSALEFVNLGLMQLVPHDYDWRFVIVLNEKAKIIFHRETQRQPLK
jgi:hypothetical protein